jgi:hypothetical protein
MKRVPPKWIWAGLAIVLLCIVIAWHCKGWSITEGFQYKTLNVPYTKEVFLVGNTGSFANGVLYQDAEKVCQKYGATLATMDQLKLATDASANWCRYGGWISGDSANLYYPQTACPNDTNPCVYNTRSTCLRKMAPQSGKGYATCYGVKPNFGSEADIQFFNDLYYSVLDTPAVTNTMTGGANPTDLIPYTFTASQALWALEQTKFTTVTKEGVSKSARQWLRENLNTVNTTIRTAADPTPVANEDINAWFQAKTKSCEAIASVRSDIGARLNSLKQIIATVEGRTRGTFYAKQENMDLQREVAYICKGLTAEQSPACSRLASIDFDIFYKSSGTNIDTKILSDLQQLNYDLRYQECFIQRALLKIQILSDYLKCPAADAATQALLGDYKTSPTTYYPDTCEDLSKNAEWAQLTGDNDKRFTIKKNIGYVSSEALRVAFEEISPFFASEGYRDLFRNLLQYLSILIRIPDLNEYYSTDEILKSFPSRVADIVSSATAKFTS